MKTNMHTSIQTKKRHSHVPTPRSPRLLRDAGHHTPLAYLRPFPARPLSRRHPNTPPNPTRSRQLCLTLAAPFDYIHPCAFQSITIYILAGAHFFCEALDIMRPFPTQPPPCPKEPSTPLPFTRPRQAPTSSARRWTSRAPSPATRPSTSPPGPLSGTAGWAPHSGLLDWMARIRCARRCCRCVTWRGLLPVGAPQHQV